jgi:glutamine amidotransferase
MGVETTNEDGFGLGWYTTSGGRPCRLVAVEPSLFGDVAGSTDSEALFYLALTFGLEEDPIRGLERAVGFVEATARSHGIEHPVQMTIGVSDGVRLWAVRDSSETRSRTLFVSEDAARCARCTPRASACSAWETRTAPSSPSRSGTCPARGSRFRSPPR